MTDTMRAEDLLAASDLAAVDAAGPVEILAGLHAVNQARSLPQLLAATAGALEQSFSDRKGLILVADGGSGDETPEVMQAWTSAHSDAPAIRWLRLPGQPSRGRAVLAVLTVALRLQATAVAVVDAGLVSLTPAGIAGLLEPPLAGSAAYVSPAYAHAVSEGTLTTNLLAPMARALYGAGIQQILGGCAGISRSFLEQFLQAVGAERDAAERGAEIWLPVEAIASRAAIQESFQGRKRLDPGLAPPDLATILARTAGPFFALMERYQEVWRDSPRFGAVPQSGGAATVSTEIGEANLDRMVRGFRMGLKDLLPVWEQVLAEETLSQLYPLSLPAPEDFRFPAPLWARVACDFALAHHERRLSRDHLLRALTPLYLGRVAGFLAEVQAGPPGRLAQTLEEIGRTFEKEVDSLRARWR